MAQTASSRAPTRDILEPLTEEEAQFLAKIEDWVDEFVLPNTRKWEAEGLPDDIWRRCGELGLTRLFVPAEYGGSDSSCSLYTECMRVVATGDPALAMNLAAANALSAAHIVVFGNDDQKSMYLPGVADGSISLAWALTEPTAGSDARGVKSEAKPIEEKPGYYHINGEKMFITNGMKSDLMIVVARTSETELSAFLMESDQPGVVFGERIPTVGVKASWTSQFDMHDAVAWHTPCTFRDAINLLYRGRLGIAGMAMGICQKAHEITIEYGKQREQFNRRLVDMQSVQNMIADNEVDCQAGLALLRKGSAMYDAGQDVSRFASVAKLFASEASMRVTNRAVQIHGGRGMTQEHLVEKLWRDAKLTEIGEGCSEVQRLVISKSVVA